MKHNLITLFTTLLLLFNVTTEAKLPSAYASVMAHVEECDRVREISCRDNVSVELLTINRTGVSFGTSGQSNLFQKNNYQLP